MSQAVDGDVGAEGGELLPELGGAGGVGALATGEVEVAGVVAGDEVPGDVAGEGSSPTGDQDGGIGIEGSGARTPGLVAVSRGAWRVW